MLTNAQVRDAKPRKTRYEITCDALPGFILRVLPTGKKAFFVRFRDHHGKDHRRRLGLFGPGLSVDDARKLALTIITHRGDEPREAAPPPLAPAPPPLAPAPPPLAPAPPPSAPAPLTARAPAPTGPPRPLTVREYSARFERDHIDMYLKPQTAERYRALLRLYILPAFGDHPLDALTAADIQRLHNRLSKAPSAANYVRSVLSVMFSKAQDWGLIPNSTRNPASVVRRFRERAVERFLSPEERHTLERVLREAEKQAIRANGRGLDAIWAIRLLMHTGMRRDEVRDLRWEYIDWRQAVLRLPDSKTGKRDIVVSDASSWPCSARSPPPRATRSQGLVICSCTGIKLHSLGRTWRRLRELAGIPDVRLHDLRHSVASDAIMNGVPLEVVGKMLGHRNYHTTQRYAHIADTCCATPSTDTSKDPDHLMWPCACTTPWPPH
jgi:integrase